MSRHPIGAHEGTRHQGEHHDHPPDDRFPDGTFGFWTALFGSAYNDARVVIRVREDRAPAVRAREKGPRGFDRVVPGHRGRAGRVD